MQSRQHAPHFELPANMPRTAPLGLIGGMSWRSASLYYTRVNRSMERRGGQHCNATGMLATLQYASLLQAAEAGRWDQVEQAIIDSGRRLQQAGCRVVALTAVTAHISHSALSEALTVPVPHILDATAARLDAIGAAKVGVLGTKRTCAASFVVEKLGVDRQLVFAPAELQSKVDELIQERLTTGETADADRDALLEAIWSLAKQGADAIVLACTELPLLLPLPNLQGMPAILDAVDLHVEALCDLISVEAAA
jgi:aspartate racemase